MGKLTTALVCALLCAPMPGTDGGQAVAVQSVYSAWAAGTSYKEDDRVGYVGVVYVCLKAHVAQAGKEPSAAPDLWRVFSGTDATAPLAPQGLAALPDGPARIVVSWSLSREATSYDLQVDDAVKVGVTSPFLHKNLGPGSTHVYRVRAVNDAGSSPWSEPVTCRSEKPGSPTSGR